MPELPLPLPALAGLAGVGGFLGARFLSSPGTPTPDAPPAADTSAAGNAQTSSDLFSSFGGDSIGLGDTGGGTLNGAGSLPSSGPPDPYGSGGIPTGTGPVPPPSGSNPPPPSTAPTSSAPASIGPRPGGAVGWISARITTLYTVSRGVATAHVYSGLVFSAWVGPAAHYKPNATLRRILTGGHAGQYVHVTDVTVH